MINDKPYSDSRKTITGLTVSQTGPLELTIAAGTIDDMMAGEIHTLPETVHTFTPHPTFSTRFYIGVLSPQEIWIDQIVMKNKWSAPASKPDGYARVIDLAWGVIGPNETDLANADISRRVYL